MTAWLRYTDPLSYLVFLVQKTHTCSIIQACLLVLPKITATAHWDMLPLLADCCHINNNRNVFAKGQVMQLVLCQGN